MTTLDLAGEQTGAPTVLDRRVQYSPPQCGEIGYRLSPARRRPLHLTRVHGEIRLSDPTSGLAASGASYLEAIQALSRMQRRNG